VIKTRSLEETKEAGRQHRGVPSKESVEFFNIKPLSGGKEEEIVLRRVETESRKVLQSRKSEAHHFRRRYENEEKDANQSRCTLRKKGRTSIKGPA